MTATHNKSFQIRVSIWQKFYWHWQPVN